MSTATTTKAIDVPQLCTQLGVGSLSIAGAEPASTASKTVSAAVPQATLESAIAAHVSPPSTHWITREQFRDRFTATERAAIRASTDAQVKELWELALLVERVNLKSQRTQDGVRYLETLGLTAVGRANTILTP